MHEHALDALDAMIYAWQVLKEKEESKMEGIFVGKIDQTAFDPRRISLSFRTKHLDQHVEVRKELDYNCDYMLVKADNVIINNDELLKLRDRVAELEEELMEIKTARTLREAYIAGVEKGCESLREDRDYWKRRWNSVITDVSKTLSTNGVEFTVKEIDGDKWNVGIDIPELNEAKKKITDLEEKLSAAKSNETFWRDRKEEEEDYHHYWLHTYDRVVKQAADKGIHIDIRCTDEECNAGIVTLDNMKAEDLEKQVVQMEDANQKLRQRISADDEEIEAATKRGDYWKRKYDDLAEYWYNTWKDLVATGKKVGVKIGFEGDKPDSNAGKVHITNEKALGLAYELNNIKQKYDKKWSAMTEALKDKGVEVIYMGEEDGKPIVDVKIPAIDILRKDYVVRGQAIDDLKREIENLKSKKVATCTLEADANGRLKFIYTYMDGHNESAPINGAIDAESISHGTIPKCSSCAHYESGSRSADVWCRKPVSKKGPGTVRRLSAEEAEGPACSDFKARKE